MAHRKPADMRTISFLDGRTEEEREAEALRIRVNADLETNEDRPEAKPMEESMDGWRKEAFRLQEFATKHFADPEGHGNQYRLSLEKGWYYLEQAKRKGNGPQYGYAGVMFPEEDIFALAEVLVAAAREMKKRG